MQQEENKGSSLDELIAAKHPIMVDEARLEELGFFTRAFWQKDRWRGKTGIPYYKVGSRVLYDLREVAQYFKRFRVTTTSDYPEQLRQRHANAAAKRKMPRTQTHAGE
jgi:hypothetical protein